MFHNSFLVQKIAILIARCTQRQGKGRGIKLLELCHDHVRRHEIYDTHFLLQVYGWCLVLENGGFIDENRHGSAMLLRV